MTDDLHRSYREAGFGVSLPRDGNPAVVVVDFVMAYLEPSSPLYAGVEAARESCVRVVAAARRAGVPVVFTRVEYEPGGADGGVFYRKVAALKVFDRGSPLGAFAPGLEPAPGEIVITKQYASAFFGTSLAATLVSRGIDTVIVAGVTTSGCVRATALDAMQNGLVPLVVRDAVGDRDPAPHEANLFDLQAKYADVITEDEALAVLRARAPRRPEAKAAP